MGIFIFIGLLLYSIWICRLIVKRRKANGTGKEIGTCVGVVFVSGLFFIGAYICSNYIVTIASGEICHATVTEIDTHTTTHHRSSRKSSRRSFSSTTYAPVLQFQMKDGSWIKQTLNIYTNEKPEIGDIIEIRYSPLTKVIFVNSWGAYAWLCGGMLVVFALFLLEVIFLSYALKGTIPALLEPGFRKLQRNMFILFITGITWTMALTLGTLLIQWLFFGMHTDQFTPLAAGVCGLFALVTGTVGIMLLRSLTKKKKTRRRGRKPTSRR